MDHFYTELDPFIKFTDFADVSAYTSVPDDWLVLCADIQGSTKAIECGKYKDVNMIGAACITAVLNVAGSIELPFVFGGDGAVILIPPPLRQVAERELVALQLMAYERFQLELRVGVVPVTDLRARKTDVTVRKYQLSIGNYLAMFSGGGIELAETLLKSDVIDNPYALAPSSEETIPSLEGLSCRWEPLRSKGGLMLTLMVKANSKDDGDERRIMGEVLETFAQILGNDPQNTQPTSTYSMKFRWPPRNSWMEAVLTAGGRGVVKTYIKVILTSLVQVWCDRFGKKAGDYDGNKYTDELRANTDYRKYDDMLRMVLDVDAGQAEAIEHYLQTRCKTGDLVYGTHRAKTALMTCVVFSLKQSEHIHFVDGADGGFAMAAVELKRRMRKA